MSYSVIDASFRHHDGALGAAEAHGIATGMLCLDINWDERVWLDEVVRDSDTLDDGTRKMFSALFERTRQLLQDGNCEFELFLPAGEEPLQHRAEALRDWCQGFLFGIGFSRSQGDWPGECAEIIQDILEISRVDTAAEGEEDENAFTHVHEYLRAAVLLLREEFVRDNDNRRQQQQRASQEDFFQ